MNAPQLHGPGGRAKSMLRLALALVASAWLTAAQAVDITPPTLPGAAAGNPYSVSLTASGGVAPYTFTNEVGRLPNGLSLTPAGLLSGTPQAMTVPFEIWATDVDGREAKLTAATNLITSPLVQGSTPLPTATVGSSYIAPLPAPSGGLPPYSCSIASGTLPLGITLGSNCVLSGTPAAPGVYVFVVRVTDQNSSTTLTTFALDVIAGVVPALNGFTLSLLAGLIAFVAGLVSRRRRRH